MECAGLAENVRRQQLTTITDVAPVLHRVVDAFVDYYATGAMLESDFWEIRLAGWRKPYSI
jgi:hypothetical protein